MMYENAAPRSCETAGIAHDLVTWEHPLRNARICMPCRTMSMLANEALRRLKAKQPCEMGGVLWGKQILDQPEPSTVIEEAQLVPAESALYNSSAPDSLHLVRALNAVRNPGLKPVGYFRSHIRDGLALSAEDQEFIAGNMRDPNAIFLLIRPFEIGICMGGFFFWQDGRLQTDASDLEVPFLATIDGSGVVEARTNVHSGPAAVLQIKPRSEEHAPGVTIASPVPPPPQHRPTPEYATPRPRQAAAKRLRPLAIIGIVAAAFLVFSGASVGFSMWRSHSHASPDPGVGLRVSRLDTGQLDLSWNRGAAEIQKAQTAKLAITDGPLHQELNIDRAQLHLGRLIYFPTGSDVQFRLQVFLEENRSLTESVRVIAPIVKVPGAGQASNGGMLAGKGRAHQPAASAQGTVAFVSSGLPAFRSPELVPGRTRVPVHDSGRSIPRPDIRLDAGNGPPPPTGLAPLPKPTSPPVAPEQMPARPAEGLTNSSIPAFVPPHPVREVMPDVRLLGPSAIRAATEVAVRVRIDEAGAVSEAALVSDAKTPNRLLSAAAVNAAKQWKFAPGTIHGKPIATEHTIIFDFRPRTP